MRSFLTFLAIEAAAVATAQKVIPFDIQKHASAPRHAARSKRATVTAPLGNAGNLYYTNITVGTPGQLVQLQLDTGSSDVWMTYVGADFCQQSQYSCIGGTFDPQQSSTFQDVGQNQFNISYVDGTGSVGDFFTDQVVIGGTTLDNQQMGLALQTTIGTGIIGVGFANDESVCNHDGPCQEYTSIIQRLVKEREINSQAYSLWLNDLDANTGSLLLGGIDTEKFEGQLVTLPIHKDSQSNDYRSFTVAWTGFDISTPKGPETNFVPQDFAEPAILDSGTSVTIFPDDLAQKLFDQFGAQYDQTDQVWLAPCYLTESNVTLDFQFGGSNGPTIKVPASEFLIDLGQGETGSRPRFDNGDVACELGFESAQGRPILLGDTFLRSAYVVYDLDNRQISIAQTTLNSKQQNVQEIKSGPGGVPEVASTAIGPAVLQTNAAGATVGVMGAPTQGLGGAGSGLSGSTGKPPLAAFTTAKYTPGVTGNGAASAVHGTSAGLEGIVTFALVTAFMFVGSGLILL